MLSTPPRFEAGESASLMNRTGTFTRMRARRSHALEIDVQRRIS